MFLSTCTYFFLKTTTRFSHHHDPHQVDVVFLFSTVFEAVRLHIVWKEWSLRKEAHISRKPLVNIIHGDSEIQNDFNQLYSLWRVKNFRFSVSILTSPPDIWLDDLARPIRVKMRHVKIPPFPHGQNRFNLGQARAEFQACLLTHIRYICIRDQIWGESPLSHMET